MSEPGSAETPEQAPGVGDGGPPGPGRTRPRGRRIAIGFAVLAGMALLATGYWYRYVRGRVTTDDARIGGHLVDLAPQVAGSLEQVMVREGERIRRGQVVFAVDKSALRAAVARARAAVSAAEAGVQLAKVQLSKAVHGPRRGEISAAHAAERRLAARLALARTQAKRSEALAAEHAISPSRLDRAKAAREAAEQAHLRAVERLRLLKRGSRTEDVEAARRGVKIAEAKLARAKAELQMATIAIDRAKVVAPFDGVVARRWLDPGDSATPGRAVVTLYDPKTVRVDANVEEKYLHEIEVGDRVTIDVDAYPDVQLHGRVSTILPATNSQFSLIPAEGTSGTFIKVAQRIPLRVQLDRIPEGLLLGPGLSVELVIHSHSARRVGRAQAAHR